MTPVLRRDRDSSSAREARPASVASGRSVSERWRETRRGGWGSGSLWFLVGLTAATTGLILTDGSNWPLTMLVLPLVLGSIYLGPRELPWYVVLILTVLAALIPRQETITFRIVVAIGIIFVLAFIILLSSLRRTRLGVAGTTGESMLVDLRDRIQSQGQIPDLPPQWQVESALRSAGGTPFAGDFVVAGQGRQGNRLDLVVVDVSGKGIQAGTRSLLLAGAFGGLLEAMPPASFLPAANDYLMRQEWIEGFATAVHVSLDLETGHFELHTAGHPPAVQYNAGSGRWVVHETEGPVLGLIDDAEFLGGTGELRPGDALMLYTDGLVEARDRDLSTGIDQLLGESDRLLRDGFDNGAEYLIDAVGSSDDDRALLIIHHRP